MRKCPIASRSAMALVCVFLFVSQAPLCLSQEQHQPGFVEDEALSRFLRNYIGAPTGEMKTTRYSAASIDLRDDGKREVIVYLTGSSWCGTGGCTMLILDRVGVSFKVISKMPATLLPISVLTAKSNGWHDICLVTGRPLYEAVFSFNGRIYRNRRPRLPSDHAQREGVIVESTQNVALYRP
jgi:hypothetical protein